MHHPRSSILVVALGLLVSSSGLALAQSASPRGPAASPAVNPAFPTSGSPSAPGSPIAIDAVGPLTWRRVATDGSDVPGAREDHTLTVDPAATAAWLFGGRDGGRAHGDLWRLDLLTDRWQRLDPPGDRPAARFGHTATWLPDVGLVVFGGQAGATFFDDLWAFDPASGAWSALPGEGRRPEARYGTCAVLAPDGRLWISHGFTASGRFGDTRAWDPETGRWTVETPRDGAAPVDRCLHDCVWTPDGRLLLYGGQTDGVPALGDLWALDVTGGRWRRQEAPMPGARRLYGLATEGAATAWLFGGADDRDRPLGDLWRLDLATLAWSPASLSDGSPQPGPRFGATLIADPARGRLLLFGGEGREGRTADLWVLSAVP